MGGVEQHQDKQETLLTKRRDEKDEEEAGGRRVIYVSRLCVDWKTVGDAPFLELYMGGQQESSLALDATSPAILGVRASRQATDCLYQHFGYLRCPSCPRNINRSPLIGWDSSSEEPAGLINSGLIL